MELNPHFELSSAHPDIRNNGDAVAATFAVAVAGVLGLPVMFDEPGKQSSGRMVLEIPNSDDAKIIAFGSGLGAGWIGGEFIGIARGTVDHLSIASGGETYLTVSFLDLDMGALWAAARPSLEADDVSAFEHVVAGALTKIGNDGLDIHAADGPFVIEPGWIDDAGFRLGLRGDDVLFGSGRGDVLRAGPGDDRIDGGRGGDLLVGQTGDDKLFAGIGNDRLFGGRGHDVLFGDRGADRLEGGAGNDEIEGWDGADVLRGGRGRDELSGGAGRDRLDGGRHGDVLDGGTDTDQLDGRKGDDTLFGRAGRDTLRGGGGDDVLAGGAGDDKLVGGRGRDVLDGGAGADLFVFAAGGGIDRIVDFSVQRDQLDFGGMNVRVRDIEDGARIVFEGGRVDILGLEADDLPL